MNTLKIIDEAIEALELSVPAHQALMDVGKLQNRTDVYRQATQSRNRATESITNLKALREKLGSEELVEEVAQVIRLQDIGHASDLSPAHEYLDGSRTLAKAALATIKGE